MNPTLGITVGYLAPEIPGLSSTFVYKEIFAMRSRGIKVETFSVHHSQLKSYTDELKKLDGDTTYLYESSLSKIAGANLTLLANRPLHYLKTLFLLIGDVFKLLTQPRTACGQIYRFLISAVLAKQILVKQVRHLHIHFANVPTDIGMYAARLAGISFSVTAHANDIFRQFWLVNEKIERSAFVATISNFNIDMLVHRGAALEKMKLVRCGVNPADFQFRTNTTKNEVAKFGFLGRLVEKKGAEFLVAAAEILVSEGISDFEIEIAGSGPLSDNLDILIKSKNLTNRICLKGEIPNESVPNWLETLDCFVLPCVKDKGGDMDGIPVALMESMLKGIPVISTEISGIPELVIDGKTGLLASPGNAQSLAECIKKTIFESQEETNARITEANSHVQKHFGLEENTKVLLQHIFDTATSSPRTHRA